MALGPQWHLHIEIEDEGNWDDPLIEVPKEPGKDKSMQHLWEFYLETSFNTKSGNVFEKIEKHVALGWKFNTLEFA